MAMLNVKSEFDAIWMYEIMPKSFEQVEMPKVGIFEAQKNYFVVFCKGEKVSIVLWRGSDQSSIDLKESVRML